MHALPEYILAYVSDAIAVLIQKEESFQPICKLSLLVDIENNDGSQKLRFCRSSILV